MLGQVLLLVGRYAEARDATARGAELLPENHPWRQSASWQVQRCERLVKLLGRLPRLLKGEEKPADNAERLDFAQVAYDHKKYVAATRLWTEAMEDDPKLADNRQTQHRYNAACAAALAAAGQGKDEPALDEKALAKLRRQALDWLKAERTTWQNLLESGPPQHFPVWNHEISTRCPDHPCGALRAPGRRAGPDSRRRRQGGTLVAGVSRRGGVWRQGVWRPRRRGLRSHQPQ
jgi:hypothetical protein